MGAVRAALARGVPALGDLVLPAPCPGCGAPGERWCATCRAGWRRPRWYEVPGLPPVIALARYAGAAREVVLAYKERGRRDLAGLLAEHVGDALTALDVPPAAIVPAPSRPAAARARGGDHMRRLARAVVDRSGGRGPATVPCVAPALALGRRARDSVGLDADARAANLARHLRLRPTGLPPPGCAVVLLDDVATTGATARAGVALLERSGRRPDAVVVLTVAASLVRPCGGVS